MEEPTAGRDFGTGICPALSDWPVEGQSMIHSLPATVHRHKRLILVLLSLVILPLICVAAFPYLLSLTVPPDRLQVFEVTDQKARNGTIVHLDEQNIREYPVLEEVLLGSGHDRPGRPYAEGDLRRVGEVEYPEKITQTTIDWYIIDSTTGTRKYFEYAGRYYRIGTVYQD